MTVHFSDAQVETAYNAAPALVQDALSGDEITAFGIRMLSMYQLHIDTAGSISELIRDLLLGLISPSDFSEELKNLGLSTTVSQNLIRDVNEHIFIPIRNRMQESGQEAQSSVQQVPAITVTAAPAPTTPVAQPAAKPLVPEPAPAPMPVVQAPPISYAQPAPAQAAQPVPPTTSLPTYTQTPTAVPQSVSQYAAEPVAYVPYTPPAPGMPPQPVVPATPMAPISQRPLPPTPANLPGTAPVMPAAAIAPVAPAQIPNIPGAVPFTSVATHIPAMPEVRTMAKDMSEVEAGTYEQYAPVAAAPQPVIPPTFAPVVTPTPAPKTQNEQQLHEVLKQYGIDPYREPVE